MNHEKCPQCAHPIEADPHFAPWCDQCNWNLEPVKKEKSGLTDKIYEKLGKKWSAFHFAKMTLVGPRPPKISLVQITAVACAVLVHGLSLIILGFGAYILQRTWNKGGL
ncbi:MAG: hypothetical protein Q7S13_01310 [Candidatus Omnitrophota bacterium]|nr:hypothetical protein [Candidatus Omnitrophota bacterium]